MKTYNCERCPHEHTSKCEECRKKQADERLQEILEKEVQRIKGDGD